jgi:hypothetical protein
MKRQPLAHPVFGLDDAQLQAVLNAAVQITDPDKRGVFLVRLGAHLREAGPDLPMPVFERLLLQCLRGLAQPDGRPG